MSGDLISRQAAIDALNGMKIYRQLDSDRWVISDCINKIVNLPSAERRGRWIKITNDWVDDAQYVCSCCGRLLTVSNRLTELVSMSYPYCHCGSKMDGKDE